MCFIAAIGFSIYFSLFRIKIFNLYRLIPSYSDASSLLFVAVFLNRVIPTLCFNYLQMLGIQSETTDRQTSQIAFVRVYGTIYLKELELIGFLGGMFADLFPLLIVLIALITFFNVVGRLGALCRFERYIFQEYAARESIAEGRALLQNAREELLKKMGPNRSYDDYDDDSYRRDMESPSSGLKSRFSSARDRLKNLLKRKRSTAASRVDDRASEREHLRPRSQAFYGAETGDSARNSPLSSSNILDLL